MSTETVRSRLSDTIDGGGPADAGDRGSLHVADRVIEKIAVRAATEVEHTAPLATRLTDRLPRRHARTGARADLIRSGRLVQLRVDVAIDYPVPITQVTREVRSHVRDVVTRLCGVEVRDVDVDVTRLRLHSERGRVQ